MFTIQLKDPKTGYCNLLEKTNKPITQIVKHGDVDIYFAFSFWMLCHY